MLPLLAMAQESPCPHLVQKTIHPCPQVSICPLISKLLLVSQLINDSLVTKTGMETFGQR